jgi:pyruvate dehydrogenase (quinone)/pyruvate oxidase
MGPAHVENVAELACRIALSRRTVTHITIPTDFQGAEIGERSRRNIGGRTSAVMPQSAAVPAESDLRKAAEILNSGTRVAILAGRGALGAADELEQLADVLAAPIAKPLLGKAAVPDDSPYTTGSVGLLGTKPSQEAMEQCDTLLMIGTSFPYIEFLPKPGQARGIQIDANPTRIGLRYPVEVGLLGDCRSTIHALLPMLRRHEDRSFLAKAQEGMREWQRLMDERGTNHEIPMKPWVVAWELGRRLRDDAIVCGDSGTVATWFARQLPAKRHQMYSLSGTLASMANGLPYAIAAQLAHPQRQVVALVGDGAFTMLIGELATAVKYQLPIKIVVMKNDTLAMIKWEQMVFEGNPEYGCELQPIDFAAVARGFGVSAYTIDDPGRCGPILDEALAIPGPAVIEAVIDPFVPPMPPKVTLEQAAQFAKALLRGEPNREKIAWTVVGDRIRELV